jgi:hypothetical protein
MHEEQTVHNAGLVLCAPFLPRLFSELGFTDANRFKDTGNAGHAAILLEYMVVGTADTGNGLLLNRLLCGIGPAARISSPPLFTRQEKDATAQLLQTVIRLWRQVEKTPVQTFIGSFLVREGTLYQEIPDTGSAPGNAAGCWYLKIEQKAYDVLLDSLPWSYTPIKYQWMPLPLYVKWR